MKKNRARIVWDWARHRAAMYADLGPLLEALRSPSLEITMEDREFVATFLEGGVKRRPGRPIKSMFDKMQDAAKNDAWVLAIYTDEALIGKNTHLKGTVAAAMDAAKERFIRERGHEPDCAFPGDVEEIRAEGTLSILTDNIKRLKGVPLKTK